MITRQALTGLACGAVTGLLVLGVGGRIIMRLLSVLAAAPPDFSVEGTVEVLAFGGLIGMASGLLLGLVHVYVPVSWSLRGVLCGAAAFFAVILLPGTAKNAAFSLPELFPVTVTLFAALFVLFGVTLAISMNKFQAKHAAQ